MKKNKIVLILAVLLVVGISLELFSIISNENKIDDNSNNSNDIESNEEVIKYTYNYDVENKSLTFYDEDEIIKEYQIDNEFMSLRYAEKQYPEFSNKYILYSGYKNGYYDKVFLLDLEKKTYKEFDNIKSVVTISSDDDPQFIKYIGLSNIDEEIAIIDLDGKYAKKFTEGAFSLLEYENYTLNDYSYYDNIITTKINGKYGLESITGNVVIIKHKYEDLHIDDSGVYNNYELYSKKYVKVKEDGKWYLYDLNTKKKATKVGYDRLYLLDDNVLLVLEGNNFSIKDYNDNLITNGNITVDNIFAWLPKRPEGVYIYKDPVGVYNISICDGVDQTSYKTYNYQFNLNTKTLEKIDY